MRGLTCRTPLQGGTPYFARAAAALAASAANSSRPNAVPESPPTTFCRLGEDHPGTTRLRRVAGDLGHNLRDLFDESPLPLAGQRRGRRDHLDAHRAGGVGRGGVNRVRVQSVDERSGVVQVERSRAWHTLSRETGQRGGL